MAKYEWTPERRAAYSERMKRLRAEKLAQADEAVLQEAPAAIEPDPEIEEAVAEEAEVEADDTIAADRRRRLLADLPPDQAALITDDELAEIEREAMAVALADQKRQALTDAKALARQYARIEHHLIPSSVLRSEDERRRLAEKVRIRIDLPEGGGSLGFRIDGRLFRQGMEYTVTRAEFESLQYTFYRAHLNEVEFSTLDQHKRGNSAREVLSRRRPRLEVLNAA